MIVSPRGKPVCRGVFGNAGLNSKGDEVSTNLYYDDFEIGKVYPVFGHSISQDELAVHRRCYEYTPEWDGPDEAARDDSMIPPFALNSFLAMRASFGMPDGVLHSREAMTLHAPAYASDQLEVELSVIDKYERNGRPFIVFRHRVTRQGGEPVMDIDRTICWIRPQGGEK